MDLFLTNWKLLLLISGNYFSEKMWNENYTFLNWNFILFFPTFGHFLNFFLYFFFSSNEIPIERVPDESPSSPAPDRTLSGKPKIDPLPKKEGDVSYFHYWKRKEIDPSLMGKSFGLSFLIWKVNRPRITFLESSIIFVFPFWDIPSFYGRKKKIEILPSPFPFQGKSISSSLLFLFWKYPFLNFLF